MTGKQGSGNQPTLPTFGERSKSRYFFKSCPKCGNGDLIRNSDWYGWYLKCLHCGYMKDIESRDDLVARIAKDSTGSREGPKRKTKKRAA